MPYQDNGGFSRQFSNLKNVAACPWEEPASVDMFMWFPEVGGSGWGGGVGGGEWHVECLEIYKSVSTWFMETLWKIF